MRINSNIFDKISDWFLSRTTHHIFLLSFLGIPLYLWLFSIIHTFSEKKNSTVHFSIAIFPALYILLFFVFIGLMTTFQSENIFVIILPFHFLAMACGFYLLIKSSIVINRYQLKKGEKIIDPIGFFFLAWFYIIGIWIIHPKLREQLKILNPEIELREEKILVKTKPFLFRRILAFFVDYGLFFGLFFLSCELFGVKGENGGYTGDYLIFFFIGIWFVLMIITELLFQSTIGNFLLGLKVVRKDGSRIKIWQPLLRHLVDVFDAWPLGIVGICTIKFTPNNQRLGDLLANTIVIKR